MSVTSKEVEYIAGLAKLRLEEREIPRLTRQLNEILHYVRQLDEVNTDTVEPLAHPLQMKNVFREDASKPSLPTELVLKNAPKRNGDYFSVPKVVHK